MIIQSSNSQHHYSHKFLPLLLFFALLSIIFLLLILLTFLELLIIPLYLVSPILLFSVFLILHRFLLYIFGLLLLHFFFPYSLPHLFIFSSSLAYFPFFFFIHLSLVTLIIVRFCDCNQKDKQVEENNSHKKDNVKKEKMKKEVSRRLKGH
jgi:hypothetical protein